MTADVMFVSGLPFLVTLLQGLRFLSVQYIPHRTTPDLANVINYVLSVYNCAGFIPRLLLMDEKIEKLQKKLSVKIEINTTAETKHVADIKRKICHTK